MRNYDGAIWVTSLAALVVLLVFVGMTHDCSAEELQFTEATP